MAADTRTPWWAWLSWTRIACAARGRFDKWNRPALVVLIPVLVTAGALWLLTWKVPEYCTPFPVSIIRLEVTYSASRFASLLSAEGNCRSWAVAQLGWRDMLFALVYPIALMAVYLWIERWRRVPRASPLPDPQFEKWQTYVVAAPLFAGVFDLVEDATLWIAAEQSGGTSALVMIGSVASTFKWLLLVVWAAGSLAELYNGPRGLVLRQVRFSALAIALGALPLLAIPQGQDILQRLAEGAHPFWRVVSAGAALTFGAFAVWYCARRLVQLDLDEQASPARDDWFAFYAEHVPRLLGILMLGLSGLAFARAGLTAGRFVGVAVASVAIVVLIERRRSSGVRAANPEWSDADIAAARRKQLSDQKANPNLREALAAENLPLRLVGILVAALGAVVVVPLGTGLDVGDARDSMIALRIAAMLCLVTAWLFYYFVRYRRVFLATRNQTIQGDYAARYDTLQYRARADRESADATRARRWVPWVAAGVSAALLVVLTIAPVVVGRALGTLWVLVIFTTNAVFLGSLTVVVHRRLGIGLVRIGLVLAVLFSFWNENHEVRRVPASAASLAPRQTLTEYVSTFLDSVPNAPTGAAGPVVLVAAAGGGLRAAYWAAMALSVAQDRRPEFARHVLAMSGVSGGSLGIATFASLSVDGGATIGGLPCARDAMARSEAPPLPGPYSTCVRRFMRDDFLAPTLAMMLAPDFGQRFFPIPLSWADRSRAIEQSWQRSYVDATAHSTFDSGLVATFVSRAPGRVAPLLLLNSTHVETGKRYVASAVRTDDILNDTRDVVSLLRSDVPLATAVHNSARFTYVSPAGHLDRHDGQELGRVVDGGYFENSGLVTLHEVYDLVRAEDARRTRDRRIVVLYLCNDPVSCDVGPVADSSAADSLAKTRSTLASEVMSPIQAVLGARDARGALALAEMRAIGRDFIQLNVCGRLEGIGADSASRSIAARARERVVSPPLGWSLSRLAREWMDASLLPRNNGRNSGPCPSENRRRLAALDSVFR